MVVQHCPDAAPRRWPQIPSPCGSRLPSRSHRSPSWRRSSRRAGLKSVIPQPATASPARERTADDEGLCRLGGDLGRNLPPSYRTVRVRFSGSGLLIHGRGDRGGRLPEFCQSYLYPCFPGWVGETCELPDVRLRASGSTRPSCVCGAPPASSRPLNAGLSGGLLQRNPSRIRAQERMPRWKLDMLYFSFGE